MRKWNGIILPGATRHCRCVCLSVVLSSLDIMGCAAHSSIKPDAHLVCTSSVDEALMGIQWPQHTLELSCSSGNEVMSELLQHADETAPGLRGFDTSLCDIQSSLAPLGLVAWNLAKALHTQVVVDPSVAMLPTYIPASKISVSALAEELIKTHHVWIGYVDNVLYFTQYSIEPIGCDSIASYTALPILSESADSKQVARQFCCEQSAVASKAAVVDGRLILQGKDLTYGPWQGAPVSPRAAICRDVSSKEIPNLASRPQKTSDTQTSGTHRRTEEPYFCSRHTLKRELRQQTRAPSFSWNRRDDVFSCSAALPGVSGVGNLSHADYRTFEGMTCTISSPYASAEWLAEGFSKVLGVPVRVSDEAKDFRFALSFDRYSVATLIPLLRHARLRIDPESSGYVIKTTWERSRLEKSRALAERETLTLTLPKDVSAKQFADLYCHLGAFEEGEARTNGQVVEIRDEPNGLAIATMLFEELWGKER